MNREAVTAALAELGSVAADLDLLQARIARAASVIRAEAVPPEPAPPPPPPPPIPPAPGDRGKLNADQMQTPVPVVGDKVVGAYGTDHYQALIPDGKLAGYRWSQGPRDTLRLGVVSAPKPWDVFEDAATMTLAMPREGREVPKWDILPVWGPRHLFSWTVPAVIGGKFRHHKLSRGDDGATIRKLLQSGDLPTASGPRGVGIATAYTTWHCHVDWAQDADRNMLVGQRSANPRVPFAIGITVDGRMCRLAKDGGVYYDAQMPALPNSYFFDFAYFDPDRSIQFVADTGAGRILRVQHTPSVPQSFTSEVWAEGLGQPTSLRAIGSMLYVVDALTGNVWEIDTASKARRLVRTIPWAWWIDYDSRGRLIVMDRLMYVHTIDPATGKSAREAWTPVPLSARVGGVKLWVQCSVDRAGTCGPVDAVLTCASHGAGNVDVYHTLPDGSRNMRLVHWPGRAVVGPSSRATEIAHYPWIVDFHPTQACILVHGFAEMNPTLLVPSGRLAWAPFDQANESRARQAWLDGGGPELRGNVPSLTCQVGLGGWSIGGLLTFDALAEMEPQAAADFLRSGGIGSVPRPIDTDTVRHMLRWAYYNSHEHVRQAAAGRGAQWLAEVDRVV